VQPAGDQLDDLPGAIGQSLMQTITLGVTSLRWAKCHDDRRLPRQPRYATRHGGPQCPVRAGLVEHTKESGGFIDGTEQLLPAGSYSAVRRAELDRP